MASRRRDFPRERVIDAELVQDADNDATDVVTSTIGIGQRADQQVQGPRVIARVQRREGVGQVGLLGGGLTAHQSDPGDQALGGKAARDIAQERQRAVDVAAPEQQPSERNRGIGARGLQLDRPPQRRLIALRDETVALGREEGVKELVDGGRGLRADGTRPRRRRP